MNKKTAKGLGFQIKDVEVVDLHLSSPMEQIANNVEFKFDINLEHKWNADSKQILVVCTVTTRTNADQILGQIKVACVYLFSDLSSFLSKKSGELHLPKEIVVTLNSATVSTTRGIMYTYFRGTFLHNALLPLIDINRLTNEHASDAPDIKNKPQPLGQGS